MSVDKNKVEMLKLAAGILGQTAAVYTADDFIRCAKELMRYVQEETTTEKKDHSTLTFPEFIKTCSILDVNTGMVPFIPHRFQEGLAQTLEYNDNVLVYAGRQMGISSMIAMYVLHYALKNPNSVIVLDGHKRVWFRYLLEAIESHTGNSDIRSRTLSMMEFTNGSIIIPHSEDIYRGKKIDLVVGDNSAMTRSDIANIMRYQQYQEHSGPNIVMMETGSSGKSNMMSALWHEPSFYAARMQFPWSSIPSRDQDWVSNTMLNIGPSFDKEYGAAFPKS